MRLGLLEVTTLDLAPDLPALPRHCSFDASDWRILSQHWFPVAVASALDDGPVGMVLLDQPLVAYRAGEEIVVADDLCPHRGVPLSMGHQDDAGIRCAYHGLHFSSGGLCDHIPASPHLMIPRRLHLRTYPAVERYGLVWTRLREPAGDLPTGGIPAMPRWDDAGFQQINCPAFDVGGFAGRQVEGFLDVAHFAWVHTATFANATQAEVPPYVAQPNPVGFSVDYRSEVANYPVGSEAKAPDGYVWLRHFEVHLPFTATLTVHFPEGGELVIMNAAAPMTARATRLFVPIARNFGLDIPVEAVHEFNRRVFEEDRRLVEAQKPEYLPLDPTLEAHIAADRSSIAYRRGLTAMGFSPIFAA